MAIVQCPNNHYYDDRRSDTCPYCEKLNISPSESDGINEQMTSYYESYSGSADEAQLTEAYGEYVHEYEKTIGIFTDKIQNILTVGWLVCICGAEKGKSYVIHSGINFAGRSPDMDVVLSGDDHIARENHFSVVYDPRNVSFYLVAGSEPTYLNDKHSASDSALFDGDTITAGESKFIFVPFCVKGREWK